MNFKNNKKLLHNIVKPEHLAHGTWLSFSYNPIDQPQTLSNELASWQRTNAKLFIECYNADLIVFPEFSSSGRWHYHGILRVRDPLFYVVDVPKLQLYGSIEIDTIDDIQEWLLYCTKNTWMVLDMFETFTDVRYRISTLIEMPK